MKARLLHWWRLLTQPSGRGRLMFASNELDWCVVCADGVSIPMYYDVACSYAEMFNGKVVHRKSA